MITSLTTRLALFISMLTLVIHFAAFCLSSNHIGNIVVGASEIALAFLCSHLFVRRFIIRPLKELTRSMRLLEQGNSTAKIRLNGSRQMRELSDSFNLMVDRVIQLLDTTAQQVCDLNQAQERSRHISELTEINSELEKSLDDVRQLSVQKELAFTGTINALVTTIEASDQYTHGHSSRVTKYSMALAAAAGLSEEQLKILEQAAILHDIGKIGVDKSILHKNGKLSDEEMASMREHPVIATHILRHIKQLDNVQKIVLSHHERFDGKGYPHGISGEAIPVESRIISIADTFDAMTSDRPYRKGLSLDVTREELVRNAGTQFDPGLVECFLGMLDRGELTKESIADKQILSKSGKADFIKVHREMIDGLTGISTLLVEDDPMTSTIVQKLFQMLGHTIDSASTAGEALRQFSERSYQLVLLDLSLPDSNGFTVARAIRKLEQSGPPGRTCAIICAFTSSSREEVLAPAAESGMDLFIQKPFKAEEIMGVIEMVCSISSKSLNPST